MGFPSPAEDHSDKDLSLDDYLVVHPAATFYWRFAGHDMERAGLQNGALLIVDKSLTARNGDVVVAHHLSEWLSVLCEAGTLSMRRWTRRNLLLRCWMA